jgi:sec-independent protein translocase protein TatA
MLPNLGVGEILLILVVALLLFGAKRLPELGRSLGQTVNMFKKGLRESADDEAKKPD